MPFKSRQQEVFGHSTDNISQDEVGSFSKDDFIAFYAYTSPGIAVANPYATIRVSCV